MIEVILTYRLVDGAYLVSCRDHKSIAFGCTALHKVLGEAVKEISEEQIPILAKLNHKLTEIPEFEVVLKELTD